MALSILPGLPTSLSDSKTNTVFVDDNTPVPFEDNATLTSTGVFADGEKVTLGSQVYRFKTVLFTNLTLALSAAADDIIDTVTNPNNLAVGDAMSFQTLTGGAGLTINTTYYVIAANLGVTTFQVSATPGGSAVNFTTDITAGTAVRFRDYDVLIGANQTASHLNLLRAVNNSGTPDTEYGTGTVIHPTINASSSSATTTKFRSKTPQTTPNTFASTETCTNASFGSGTFQRGVFYRGGCAFDENDQAYVCPRPAGGSANQTISFLGGKAVRGDGAQIILVGGTLNQKINGCNYTALGELIPDTTAPVRFPQGIGTSETGVVSLDTVT
jgi:hypothetical protein